MQKSDSIANLTVALVEAQKAYKPLIKKTINPFFNKKYADLAEVIECTQPALNANGLAIIQFPYFEDGKAGVETVLVHTSGEYMSERALIPGEQKNPQTFGIAVSYQRRYSWGAVAGIAPEDDDDGNGLSGKDNPPAKTLPKVDQKPAKAKEEPRPGEKKSKPVDLGEMENNSLPNKEELKDIQAKVREWADKPGATKENLITFIRREAHQEDSKLITKGAWAEIFAKLNATTDPESLAALIGGTNE